LVALGFIAYHHVIRATGLDRYRMLRCLQIYACDITLHLKLVVRAIELSRLQREG
jgi:hypothetical protein